MRKTLYMLAVLSVVMAAPVMATQSPDLQAGFTSADQHSALQLVLNAVNGTQRNIDIAAYSFTSKPVATALIAAQHRGVTVRVLADAKANSDRYTAVTFLANQGVPVRLTNKYSAMHNKFMVVDGDTVQTGSLNYSASAASRNAENVLLVKNAPTLAATYQTEFNRLWNEADPLAGRYQEKHRGSGWPVIDLLPLKQLQ